MQDHLHAGYTTQILREGDFLYSYFLWYEDVTVSIDILPVWSPSTNSHNLGMIIVVSCIRFDGHTGRGLGADCSKF